MDHKYIGYDLKIMPTKFIKGKRLANLMDDSNYKSLGLNYVLDQSVAEYSQVVHGKSHIYERYASSPRYLKDVVYFLLNLQCPLDLGKKNFRSLKLRDLKYCTIDQSLFWKDLGGMLLRCVNEDEA